MNLVVYHLIDTYKKLIEQFHLSGNWKTISSFRSDMHRKNIVDAITIDDRGPGESTWTITKGNMRFVYKVNVVKAFLGYSKSNVEFVGVRYNVNVKKNG